MPTLAALFEMVRKSGNTQVRFNIETKLSPLQADETISPEAFVDALLGVIEREKMLHRVIIHSFDWRTLKLIQQKYPMVPTVYISVQQKFADNIAAIGNNASHWTAGLNINNFGGSVPKMVKYAGGAYWSVYFGDVNQAKISEAQALGLRALVWTVNEPQDIERMLDLKVDGIITDYPNRVREAMGKRGMRLPVSTTMR